MSIEIIEITENESLFLPAKITAMQIFSPGGLDPILQEIAKKVDEYIPEIETATGRKDIASFAYKIAQTKTYIEKAGKQLVEKQKNEIKLIDQERKKARDFLDAEKDRARKPLTEWEEAEAAREVEEARLATLLEAYTQALIENDLFNRQKEIEKKEAEFKRIAEEEVAKAEAERIKKERIDYEEGLKKKAAEQATKEAEEKALKEKQAALKREQEANQTIEKAKRDQIVAEERLELEKKAAIEAKTEAALRLKIERETAEKNRLEAIQRAEEEKARAIKKATEEAERKALVAEQEKRAKAEQEAREAAKKAANVAHRKAINNSILANLMQIGFSEEDSKKFISAVAGGQIPYMQIKY